MEEQDRLSFLEKTKNFANFSWEIVSYFTKNGIEAVTVSDEVFEQRFKTCKECDRYIEEETECRECGCNVIFKAKVIFDSCPLKKWSADRDCWEEKLEELSQKIDEEK